MKIRSYPSMFYYCPQVQTTSFPTAYAWQIPPFPPANTELLSRGVTRILKIFLFSSLLCKWTWTHHKMVLAKSHLFTHQVVLIFDFQSHREKYTELRKADLTVRAREDSVIISKSNQVTFLGVLGSTFHMSTIWN